MLDIRVVHEDFRKELGESDHSTETISNYDHLFIFQKIIEKSKSLSKVILDLIFIRVVDKTAEKEDCSLSLSRVCTFHNSGNSVC